MEPSSLYIDVADDKQASLGTLYLSCLGTTPVDLTSSAFHSISSSSSQTPLNLDLFVASPMFLSQPR